MKKNTNDYGFAISLHYCYDSKKEFDFITKFAEICSNKGINRFFITNNPEGSPFYEFKEDNIKSYLSDSTTVEEDVEWLIMFEHNIEKEFNDLYKKIF